MQPANLPLGHTPRTAHGRPARRGWTDYLRERPGRLRQVLGVAAGLVCIAGLHWLNLLGHGEWDLEFLFLAVCAGVGWEAGTGGAVLCGLGAAVSLYVGERAGPGAAGADWVLLGNAAGRLLGFGAVSWLAAYAGKLTREWRGAVAEHTARLEEEIGQHKETEEMLSQTLQVFRQLTESINDVFWVTDASKGQVEYVSPAFERVWGQSCETLGLSPSVWLEGVHYQDRERVRLAVYSKQVRGDYDEEYRVVRPDGSVRWVHERAFPVRDEHGAVYRLVGIAEDITERKRTEELLQAERSVGVALSSTSDLGFALNRLLDIALQLEGIDCGGVYLAEAGSGELHLEVHRGLSGAFLERIGHYRADAAEAKLAKAGQTVYMRQEQIPRSLEVLWGSEGLRALAFVPVQNKGVMLGVLILGSYRQDEIPVRSRVGLELIASQVAGAIARIRAEESLRRSEAHLRSVIQNAPVALLAGDVEGRLTLEDGQALRAMGARPGEHVRQPASEVYRDHPLMLENVRRALGGEEFSAIVEFGATTFDCRYSPLRDKDRKPAGFIAVATDVTERFRLQREILEISEREQARIGQDVHDGLCQQLIGAALKANRLAQTLETEGHGEEATSRRLCALLDEAITESRRVCRGLYPIRLRHEGLLPALQELAATASERHQVQCRCDAGASVPECDITTATHLYRIAQEAVNNAVKHSGASCIAIRLTGEGDGLQLEIADDGKGLGHTPGPGSGMGLHIMDYRARLIGGRVELQTSNRGTAVSCHVPRLATSL